MRRAAGRPIGSCLKALVFVGLLVSALCGAFEHARSASFYLDSLGGDDRNNGRSPETAWASFRRLTSIRLLPGDTVFLRAGSFWRDEMRLSLRGAPGQPIAVQPYGDGAPPAISGANPVPSNRWEPQSDGIFRVDIGRIARPDTVYLDGQPLREARWPRDGYRVTTAAGTVGSLVDTSLAAALPPSGLDEANVAVRTRDWELSIATVRDFDPVTGTLRTKQRLQSATEKGYGYYLSGAAWMLNAPGEWAYDGKQYLYLRTTFADPPSSHIIEVPTRPFGVDLSGSEHAIVQGIRVCHVRVAAVHATAVTDVAVHGVTSEGGRFVFLVSSRAGSVLLADNRVENPSSTGISGHGGGFRISNNVVVWTLPRH